MKRSIKTKMLSLCAAASIILNISQINALSAFDINSMFADNDEENNINISAAELNGEENELADAQSGRYIVKYINDNDEKLHNEDKVYISSFFDEIILPADEDPTMYINTLKENNQNIEYIQPDYKLVLFDNNDAANNTDEKNVQELLPVINTQYRESNPIVAVIDSGIDINHDALINNIWVNNSEDFNEQDSDDNGYVDDVNGWDFVENEPLQYEESRFVDFNHGTHIAGIIAGSNDKISGACAEAKIMALKAFKDGSAYTSDIMRAINYADIMGADIVNCSFGSNDENAALKETIELSDMLFVCAAGNKAKNMDESPVYPASYDMDNVISVAASDNENKLAYFSNYGENVDIAAPGSCIYSSLSENEYGNMSGTSMAAAYVSGVAANILMSENNISVIDVKERLLSDIENEIKPDDAEYSIKVLNYSVQAMADNNTDEMNLSSADGAGNKIKQISAGGYHSVVLAKDKVYAFGCNDHNQCSGTYFLVMEILLLRVINYLF